MSRQAFAVRQRRGNLAQSLRPGAGNLDHMVTVLSEGKADAVLAASIFHFGTYTVGDVKRYLAERKVPVRL